jgi:hypothetical protein
MGRFLPVSELLGAAPVVRARVVVGKVAVAVDLDDHSAARAIEVHDVLPKRLLPRELLRQVAEEIEP